MKNKLKALSLTLLSISVFSGLIYIINVLSEGREFYFMYGFLAIAVLMFIYSLYQTILTSLDGRK
jgi:hypothetical protein